MDQALVDWEAKDTVDKAREKAKACFTKEYGISYKHAAIEAKQARYGSSASQVCETPSTYPFE